jgi:hypothetical protein
MLKVCVCVCRVPVSEVHDHVLAVDYPDYYLSSSLLLFVFVREASGMVRAKHVMRAPTSTRGFLNVCYIYLCRICT